MLYAKVKCQTTEALAYSYCDLAHKTWLSRALKDWPSLTLCTQTSSSSIQQKCLLVVSATDISTCVNHLAWRLAGVPPRLFRDNTRQPEDNPLEHNHTPTRSQTHNSFSIQSRLCRRRPNSALDAWRWEDGTAGAAAAVAVPTPETTDGHEEPEERCVPCPFSWKTVTIFTRETSVLNLLNQTNLDSLPYRTASCRMETYYTLGSTQAGPKLEFCQ